VEQKISHQPTTPVHASTAATSIVDPEIELSVPPGIELEEMPSDYHDLWGVGPFRFRFRLSSLRPGRDFTERRFSIAEAAFLLMMAYLASRGLGVVRQTLFNSIFGTSPAANAYYAAFKLPDTLFTLIAGGALIQAFVPVFVSYEREQGWSEMWRLTSLVLNVLLVTLTVLVLTRIMLIHPLILGLGTVATAILSSKRQFLLPALSIAVYNLGLIGGLLVTMATPEVGVYGPTFGVLAGAACQVLVQLPSLVKQRFKYSFIWDLKHPGLRQVMLLLGPNVVAVGVASIAQIIETAFISYLPDKGSLSAIHNAFMLFDLPVALCGQALALAALPRLSRLAVDHCYQDFRRLVFKLVGGAVLVSIPTAVLLSILGKPAIYILFQHGAFTRHSSALTALALIGYAIGLPGQVALELLIRSFYALKNALIPLLTTLFAFAAHIGLILLLLKLMTGKYLVMAIPLAVASVATVEAGLLCLLLLWRLRTNKAGD
jgi:putative peptidoglycan lipid II flippase